MKSIKMTLLGTAILGAFGCVSLSPQESRVAEEVPALQFDETRTIQGRLDAGDEFLKKGYYKEALDEFKAVLKVDRFNEPAQKGAELSKKKFKAERERIVQSLIQLKDSGQNLYQRQEYVQAGQAWKEAIQLYQTQKDPAFQREVTINVDEIQAQLDRVIQAFLEKGVFLYRQGKLEAAVAAWQDVLLIDPQQNLALDYINKARTKIETLEHLSSTSAAAEPSPEKQNTLFQTQTK